jgi:hypothetical protein
MGRALGLAIPSRHRSRTTRPPARARSRHIEGPRRRPPRYPRMEPSQWVPARRSFRRFHARQLAPCPEAGAMATVPYAQAPSTGWSGRSAGRSAPTRGSVMRPKQPNCTGPVPGPACLWTSPVALPLDRPAPWTSPVAPSGVPSTQRRQRAVGDGQPTTGNASTSDNEQAKAGNHHRTEGLPTTSRPGAALRPPRPGLLAR